MKAKISTFIAAIAFLTLGITTASAQGAKATFKKNGTTVFQSAVSGIDSIVFRQENPYDEKGLELVNEVSEQCDNYIESYLQQYFSQSGNADINDLVNKIKNIDEVEEASPNDDNSVIKIKLKSGAYINHLIFRMDDERLFTAEQKDIYQQFLSITSPSNSSLLRSTAPDYNTPTIKKALILAPFQFVVNENLSEVAMFLKNAGFDVTIVENENVTIDYFRGDSLKQYGVIYIQTHGAHSLRTLSGEENSMAFLLTSNRINHYYYIFSSYSKEDMKDLAGGVINGVPYLAVSERWINRNLNSLPNSLVYIDACQSAKDARLSTVFFNNGAKAYVGWVYYSYADLFDIAARKVFNELSKGKEFDEVFSSPIWSFLKLPLCYPDTKYCLNGYFHYKIPSNVPFYLIKKEEPDWVEINGVKWATRNVGAPHTFVQNPENYGEYYQWNNGTTDWIDGWNGNGASFWLSTNDPSPAGYRVPTSAEIQSLLNSTYVTYEWTTRNGVYGGRFTDRTNGNSIFLPAAGYRSVIGGTLISVSSQGMYWSSSQLDSNYAYSLCISSLHAYLYGSDGNSRIGFGYSIRPVAK